MKRLFMFLILLALFNLACRFSTSNSLPSLSTGEIVRTLTHDGRERSYILYVPSSLDWSQPLPLVFVFHGGSGNAKSAIHMTRFNQVADQNRFLVIYPNGTDRPGSDTLLTWNGGDCCAYAQENKVGDVGTHAKLMAWESDMI